jgi:hypothetical protein
MNFLGGTGYSKRSVPTNARELPAWLPTEFGNIERRIASARSKVVTANYTATVGDGLILANGAITVTLPNPRDVPDMVLTIKRIGAAGTVTIGGTVDGALNPTLGSQYASKTIWAHVTSANIGTWHTVASV